MNYFDMMKAATQEKTALITEGKAYTYGELVSVAERLSEKVCTEHTDKNQVYVIQENNILKQLTLFLACNACGIVPVIAPADIEINLTDTCTNPEAVCMGVMTSGSTGEPKILYRTYESWAEFFPTQNKIFGIGRESVLFAQGSLAFSGNMNMYMAQFFAGATVVAENVFHPREWLRTMEKEKVTAIYLIPSKLMLLPQVAVEHDKNRKVTTIISGSQSLGRQDADLLKGVFPGTNIILYYGASELSYITYVEYKDMTDAKNLVGRPFPGVRVSVHEGEILVETDYHAEGILCPYALSDRGYIDGRGNLYFEGRSDDIVMIKGRKVSMLRIENELKSLEFVEEAAAVPSRDNNHVFITAFVVCTKNESDILENIYKLLRKRLAHYEMPGTIKIIEEMPHNESGKVDKKVLEGGS